MRLQTDIYAYITIELGEVETEFKLHCEYMSGLPATWYEPADGPEIHIKSIERIAPDPKHPGLFKNTGDMLPDWMVAIIQDDFYSGGYVHDQVMDAVLDADGH